MEYSFIGRTGLQVSRYSLGAMTFGGSGSAFFEGVGGTTQQEASRMVQSALDHGVNLFDTADVYSRGLSETILGKALGSRREDVVLATKLHGRMSEEINDLGQSRHHIIRSCEASLRRLGTDYIDLLQVHNFDAYTDLKHSMSALNDLVHQGKVRYIGCSNYAAWQLVKAQSVAEASGFEKFVTYQGNYSLVARHAEHELLPACADQEMGFLVWGPLAGGFLTGKYRGQPDSIGRRAAVGDPGRIDEVQGQTILVAMEKIAVSRGVTLAEVALNWLAAKDGVTSILLGAKSLAQLEGNLRAAGWKLEPSEIAALDDASEIASPYPIWHQQQYNGRRWRVK